MQRERLRVTERRTGIAEHSTLVITMRNVLPTNCVVVIGYPGLPNLTEAMEAGDAVLIETPADGLLEVRLIEHDYQKSTGDFLISQVSPRQGLLAGAAEVDPSNSPFGEDELRLVAASIESVKQKLTELTDLKPEHVQLLSRKLDEIQLASTRLGRKDWVNYVAGSLTSVCISAAFSPEITRKIFSAVNAAFAWFFSSGVLLFP